MKVRERNSASGIIGARLCASSAHEAGEQQHAADKRRDHQRVAPAAAGRRDQAIHQCATFQEGQPIEQGAPLFTLDNSVYQAQLADAEARLELAEQTHKRTAQLFTNKYATAQSADESTSNLAVNNAAVELARVQLEKTRIAAPFDGVLGLRKVSIGQYSAPGDAIVNLEQIDPLKVDFRVPEAYFAIVQVGQTITVDVDALSGRSSPARSTPSIRCSTRTAAPS